MSEELVIVLDESGAKAVYDDRLAGLLDAGTSMIARASHVEYDNLCGGWTADMAPSSGPILGVFSLRGEALAAEREWLRTNLGL